MDHIVKAFRFSEYGGPEVLRLQEVDLPAPAAGEIQIRHHAIGLNFIDIYHRRGVFAAKLPLPSGLGVEGVGEVLAVGSDVVGFQSGDRVAYVGGPPGAYTTHRNLPAARAVKVPDGLHSEVIAATIFKGLTAEYLVHRCVPVSSGDAALFHAAAGGVGSRSLICRNSLRGRLFSPAPRRSMTSPPSLRKSGKPARWRETPAPQKKMTSPASRAMRRSSGIEGPLARKRICECVNLLSCSR